MLNVPRSNWSAVRSSRFPASGNLLVVTCA
jgi:hypothetical protein